ncbi:MAG: 4-hydroxythreonine-4-phosphate dehydrogenase PdxA [Verrucomicrobia bacterium]|nr:4-hydroxythreonine-4-phosphate dehydrogenase PdxA [Verrucomicrobiota bacterium]
MGDPAGIGPELCLRALREPAVLAECVPVLFGDAAVVQRLLSLESFSSLGLKGHEGTERTKASPCRTVSLADWQSGVPATEPLLVDFGTPGLDTLEPGQISAAAGEAGYRYIEEAIRAALAGNIAAVVTAPIHKEALRLSGVDFPGHTEIFTALTGAPRSCMMLYSDQLTVSMVTTHIGYHEVPGKLSVERVLNVIELTAEAMRLMLGRAPRIGVCGLNPHAGEHGLFGQGEEEKFVVPAVAEAKRRGIDATGPLVPDAAFTAGMRRKFDAFVCLYHDQGHIPLKMLAFDTGVNLTLGLPIIRTSVDHGTAFDIAWQGKADPTSLYSAIHIAAQLAAGRTTNATP